MKNNILLIISFLSVNIMFAQNVALKGKVIDETSSPLPGVSVFVKDDISNGTITNLDGEFELNVNMEASHKVVFSFIGYEKKEIEINKSIAYYEVKLLPDNKDLEELVVVGYGTQRKEDVSVAISTVKAENIASPAVLSLDQSLQGQAAGVVVSQSTGKPGAPVSIRIRGTSSINGLNEPLYVIDGIPIISNPDDMTTGTLQGSEINPLSSINPNDIKSINILKDASATAIYGARGANGVILITTKRGTKDKIQINLNLSFGQQKISKTLDLLNAHELAVLGNEAVTEAKKYYPDISYENCYALPDRFGEGTDWQSEIFRKATIQNYQLSIRGGNEKSVYYFSTNYVKQEGIIKESDFSKGTVRLNIDNQLSDRTKFGVNVNIARSSSNGVITGLPSVSSSVVSMALLSNPGQSPYDDTEESGYLYESNTRSAIPNPVAEINETERLLTMTRGIGDLYFDWDIIDVLKYKFKVGIDAFFNQERQYIPSYIYRGQGKGKGYDVNMNGYTLLFENTLNYVTDFGKNHINILGGLTSQSYVSNITDLVVENFEDETLGYYGLSLGKDKTISSRYNSWTMCSSVGRINYNYNQKYYATTSVRIDGSSKFGDNNKYGVFPSISVAWRASKEDFMKSFKFVDDLKLRLSAGSVGNEGIPSGCTLSLIGNRPYYYGEKSSSEVIGSYVASLKNGDLKWEVTAQYDAGIDLKMLKTRIELTAEAYLKYTSDLLLYIPVNRSSGYSAVWDNVGNMRNQGFEFMLNTVNIDKDFRWNTSFNISFNRNEITNLENSDEIYGTTIQGISDWTVIREGEALGNIYGYKSDGIIQLSENPGEVPFFLAKTAHYGDRKYVDKDKSGTLTTDDYYKLGNVYPDFSYGIRNTFSYKGIGLSIYLQGDYGNEIVNFNKFELESFDGFQNNLSTALQRWTEDNPTNEYPRANASPVGNVMSDVIVEDGSYMRIKEVVLSYTLPSHLLSKTKISNLVFSLTGTNLHTFTNYSGYDPEVSIYGGSISAKGADYGAYPMAKSILFGINATF